MRTRIKYGKRWFWRGSLFALMAILFVALPLVFPKPLFSHSVTVGELSVHSDRPIPQAEGEQFLQEVQQKLAQSPIEADGMPMQIYITNTEWRWRWLWIVPNKDAGGFVAAPVTRRHTFFSGANFYTDELISPTGYRTQPPRTLDYFGAHELTHVATLETLGLIQFYQTPTWVIEGIADYVAMPPESAADLYAKIGEQDADLAMMRAHGVYAPYRLLVTYFLEEEGWSIDQLLATDWTLGEARAVVFPALR